MPASAVPHAVVQRSRRLAARIRPGTGEVHRSLPIRRPADDVRTLWEDPAARAAVLGGIPVADASLETGGPADAWGTPATMRVRLASPLPRTAAQALAGKAVRRLKALAETGEVPTAEDVPSARPRGTGARG